VSHIRGTEPIRKIERLFGSWASRIITLNSEMNNLYASLFGDDKACIVWNGIDVDSFSNPDRDKLRREYFVIKDHFIVGTVARLIPGKGIPEFIKAAAEVLKARKDITFFIIGDDPLLDRSFENRMKQLANNLNISEQLIFTSWRDDAIDLMSGLDLVVQFSTFTEGMSLTPIEAMALGKPVVTSDVPGYVDTVEDKVTGFILPAGDVPSLARSILHLAGDRQLARDLGERGKERALTCFDARITVKRIEEIYRSIFDNGR
jgi:glycosyltransferase involved in cell wall biosynthesis